MKENLEYVGFWHRVIASLSDIVLFGFLLTPYIKKYLPFLNQTAKRSVSDFGEFFLVYNFYGLKGIAPIIWDSLKDEILPRSLPFLAVILFWFFFSATPGKMIIRSKIVNAKTGKKPSLLQFTLRYLAYFVSYFIFFIGFFWIAFDKKKQGWHDLLAGTVVVRKTKVPVQFEAKH